MPVSTLAAGMAHIPDQLCSPWRGETGEGECVEAALDCERRSGNVATFTVLTGCALPDSFPEFT